MNWLMSLVRRGLNAIGLAGVSAGSAMFVTTKRYGQESYRGGLDDSGEIHNYLFLRHLELLLGRKQVSCVLDVGANRGQYALSLRHLGYRGPIISFEPVKEVFSTLSDCAKADRNWIVYNYALGDREATAEINVSRSTDFSSLLRTNAYAEHAFGSSTLTTKAESVTVRRLDCVLEELQNSVDVSRVFLKMDTQGYDVRVFSGLGLKIRNVVAIQSEVSVIPLYDEMPRFLEAIAVYEAEGFELSGLYPITVDAQRLCPIELDCLMVKKGEDR